MTLDLDDYRHIHLVGIGGIGMSALARVLLARGFQVSGSDRDANEETSALAAAGATIFTGHRADQVRGADLIVISSAIRSGNVEVQEAGRRRIPVVKRAELLAAIANAGSAIAVAGTHGKTTTSALIGHILVQADQDPTILIGGIGHDLGSNARVGGSDLVVVEADEYDNTFLQLRPAIGVITNVAGEHLDFFRSIERVRGAFRQFAESVSETLVICADDAGLLSLVTTSTARIVSYGIQGGDWRASDIHEDGASMSFQVHHEDSNYTYSTSLVGNHNVLNALAAIATADALRISPDTVARALASFRGVKRRIERKGEVAGILVIDDYAVHPTEVKATLGAIKQRFQRPIRVVFQPHTYSRLQAFLPDFGRSFGQADAVYALDVYAARETDTLGLSGLSLVEAIAPQHAHVTYVETEDAALATLLQETEPGDIVVTMGAGTVTHLGPSLLTALEAR